MATNSPDDQENLPPLHLVLGSGGMRVLACAGAITQLSKIGFRFGSVAGCSAGALIAALVAGGMAPKDIEDSLANMDLVKAAGKRAFLHFFRYPFAMYRTSGFPKAFCDLIGGDKKLRDLNIPFSASAIDINNLETLFYSSLEEEHKDMFLSEVLSMTVAVPTLYPPIRYRGRVIVDGAFADHSNLAMISLKQEEHLPVVFTCHVPVSTDVPKSMHSFYERTVESAIATNDKSIEEYLTSGRGYFKGTSFPEIWWINIKCPNISYREFKLSPEKRVALFEAGRRAVRESYLSTGGNNGNFEQHSNKVNSRLKDSVAYATFARAEQVTINNYFRRKPVKMEDRIDNTNIVNYGNLSGGNFAFDNSIINDNSSREISWNDLSSFIRNLKEELPKIALNEQELYQANAQILTIEAQLSAPQPDSNIIRSAGKTLHTILLGIAGNFATDLVRLLATIGLSLL